MIPADGVGPIVPEVTRAEEALAAVAGAGLGDGLPVVPPTAARLSAMLGAHDDPDRILAEVAPLSVPLTAAKVRGSRATLFVLEGDVVRSVTAEVLGESGSSLFVKPTLPEGARVVTEGRAQLSDGERVAARVEPLRRPQEKRP